MLSTVARRRLMGTWRTEGPNEHGFVEDSCARDQTQDGMCTKILVRLTGPCITKGGRGSIKIRAVNQARIAGNTKGQPPWPNPTARQARVSRITPESREIVKRSNKEDDVQQ